jgi:transposase-like protein
MSVNLTNPIFNDENKARKHLETLRWPDRAYCPHCGEAENVHLLEGKSTRPGLYQCNSCLQAFTVTVGTVMERSHIPLQKWVLAFHLMNASKKGMSAHQMHRMLGVTYKSAWFMCHRIREAMRDANPSAMGGEGKSVQADETYYGNSKRAKSYRKGHRYKNKVVALVEPNGRARAFKVEKANMSTVRKILVTNVRRTSELHTDESPIYKEVGREFAAHKTVEHGWNQQGYYVGADGQTTNNVENFFGVFKRGMKGVYHFCGAQHLQRYLDEFSFRYSNRAGLGVDDLERAALAIKGATGKRLTYRPAH